MNNFAISSKGVGDALQRSASALATAGNSIDESIALIVAANEVVQDPDVVGTALKTSALRLTSSRGELEALGEDVEGAAESVTKLQTQLLNLTKGKVDIMLDKDTFKSTYQILLEMSKVWNDMSQKDRLDALELMFGKRGANVGSSIIENMSTAQKALQTSMNSSGSAMAENEVVLDSIAGRVSQFKAQFEALSNSIVNSEFLKGAVSTGTGILGALTWITDTLGEIPTLAGVAGAAIGAITNKGIFSLGDNATNLSGKEINLFGTSFSDIKQGGFSAFQKPDVDVLEKYNQALLDGKNSQAAYYESLLQTDGSLKKCSKSTEAAMQANAELVRTGGTGVKTQEALASSLNKTAISSKVAAVGMNLLNAAMNMLVGIGIGFVVDALFTGISNIANASEKSAQAAKEATDEYKTSSDSLTNYKTRVLELQEALSSGALSYEETKQKRLELLQVQENLIEQYGGEAGAIDEVTAAINGQSDAWDKLAERDYRNWKKEVSDVSFWEQLKSSFTAQNSWMGGYEEAQSELEKAKDYFEEGVHWSIDDLFSSTDNFTSTEEIRVALKQVDDQIKQKYKDVITATNGHLNINTNAYELEDTLTQIESDYKSKIKDSLNAIGIYDQSVIDSYANLISNQVGQGKNRLQENLDKYQDTYETYLDGFIKYESEYGDEYKSLSSAKNDYDQAVLASNDDLIKQSEAQLRSVYTNIMRQTAGNKNIQHYFETLFPDLNEVIKKWDFEDILSETFTGYGKKTGGEQFSDAMEEDIDNLLHKIQEYSEEDLFKQLTSGSIDSGFQMVIDKAIELGLISDDTSASVSSLIDKLVQWGIVSGHTSAAMNAFSDNYTATKESIDSVIEEVGTLNTALSEQGTTQGVSIETYEKLIAANKKFGKALEYNNGVMHINSEQAIEIAKQDTGRQIAKATTELKLQSRQYRKNEKTLDSYYDSWRNGDAAAKSIWESKIASLKSEQSVIEENITKYNVLISNIRQATDEYQLWKDSQNQPESGDMYTDLVSASQQIESGLKTGKTGTLKFDASVDLLIPDNIDPEDNKAIADYKKNVINKYLTFDEDSGEKTTTGLDNFLNDAIGAELMEEGEDGKIRIAAEKSLQDFCDSLNITPQMARAIFGELEEYDWKFDWSDEFEGELELTEEETKEYTEQIKEQIDSLGDNPATLGVNSEQLIQCESDLFDLQHQKDGLSNITDVNIKARLEINDQIDEVEGRIEELKGQPQTVEVQAQIQDAEQELLILKMRLGALGENPTELQIQLAQSQVQEEIDKLTSERDLELKANPNFDTSEIDAQIGLLENTKVEIGELDVNTETFDGKADHIETRVKEIDNLTATPKVTLDTVNFYSDLNSAKQALYTFPTAVTVTAPKVDYSQTRELGTEWFNANGTAHAGGTWGAEIGGRSLVGELGREIVVDPYSGKWHTVGDYGAEFVDIPRGAIVFNHIQTEHILKNGYVTGRGTAYAGGTALALGGEGNRNWKNQNSWGYPVPNTGSSGSSSSGSSSSAPSYQEAKDDAEEYISTLWQLYEVEKKLADVQNLEERLETLRDMTDNTAEQIRLTRQLLDAQKQEQEALHNVNEERRNLILGKIEELQNQGFNIDYDSKSNDLFIANMEHVNDLIGSTTEETNDLRKEAEDAINTIIDWNDANIDNSKSWYEIAKAQREAKREIADTSLKVFDDYIDYYDTFDLWENVGQVNKDTGVAAGVTKAQMLKQKIAEINRLYKEGIIPSAEQYKELLQDAAGELYDTQKSDLEEIIDLTKQLIKQEVENQVDALNKQIEAYQEIIRLKKEALETAKDEDSYQDQLNEKLAEMAKMKDRIDKLTLAANAGDRDAAAEKSALEEDYAKLQKELVDFQSDYAYNAQMDALDKEQEAFEKQKNKEIDDLKATIDTEAKLYQAAIDRIDSGWDTLYQDLKAWNQEYGDGISGEAGIDNAWGNAKEAMESYFNRYGELSVLATLNDLKTNNSVASNQGYGNDVKTNSAVSNIVSQMQENSRKWPGATDSERESLEKQNEDLAKQIEDLLNQKVIKKDDGAWYLEDGRQLYNSYQIDDGKSNSTQIQAEISALVELMKANGQKWPTATAEGRKDLEQQNEDLAKQIEAKSHRKLIKKNGVWYFADGTPLYSIYHTGGIVGEPLNIKENERFALLKKGEWVLNDEQKRSLFQLLDQTGGIKERFDLTPTSPTSTLSSSLGSGNIVFSPALDIKIESNGTMSDSEAKRCGGIVGETVLGKFAEIFGSSGVSNRPVTISKP